MLLAIESFLGFMVDEFYIFYYIKYHLVSFLPKLTVCKPFCYHIVDFSPSNHMIVASNFYMQYCNNHITWLMQ